MLLLINLIKILYPVNIYIYFNQIKISFNLLVRYYYIFREVGIIMRVNKTLYL